MPNPYASSPKPKKNLFKKILAWVLIVLGLLFLFAMTGFLSKAFGFITFALPGAWILLHARRESAGAEPMKRHWGIIGAIAAVSFVATVATSPSTETADDEPEQAAVATTVETTTSKTSTTRPTSSPTSTTSTTTSAAPTSTVEPTPTREPEPTTEAPAAVAVEQDEEEDDRPVGFTGGPADSTPAPMNKTIESCGDLSLHETGTTFFTDGTSGWTEQCSNEMSAARQASIPKVVEQAPAAPAVPSRGLKCADVGHKTYIGDGVYASNQDGDGDGVGCESYPG